MAAGKTTGNFLSATEESLKIMDDPLDEGNTIAGFREIQRKKIRKLLAEREFGQRYAGWVVLGISFAIFGNAFGAERHILGDPG